MCLDATRKKIVRDLTAAGKSFTAYDVTIIARQEHGVTEHHFELKKVVHALYEADSMPANYRKTLADVATGQQAFRYHPDHIDGQTGQPINGAVPAPPAATPVPAANSLTVTQDDDDDDDTDTVSKTIDQNADTLYVPRFMVKSLGLGLGDPAFVIVDTGTVRVSKNNDANHGGHQVHVDKRHNIRVATATLQKAGIFGQHFNLQVEADEIRITA